MPHLDSRAAGLVAAALLWFSTSAAQTREYFGEPLPKAATAFVEPVPNDNKVAVYYVVPRDLVVEPRVLARLVQATREVQAWYQCAAGGLTWELAFPETVRVYFGDRTRQEYADAGYYSPIIDEMVAKGLPMLRPGTVTALWARGAGFFAGANPGCGGECGVAMVGIEVFPEFNKPEWTGSICPEGVGVAAFPCTPLGAFGHELGHALASLPHPADATETQADASHSIMQSHWNYPTYAPSFEKPWGFLTLERQTLQRSPFLKHDVALVQEHRCNLLNRPVTGSTPIAAFSTRVERRMLYLTDLSQGATRAYWDFGDGKTSSELAPQLVHFYREPGTYTVTLRVSNDAEMMHRSVQQITIAP